MRKLLILLLGVVAIICILIIVPFGKSDFVGYVYHIDKINDRTTIIGEDNGDGMNVLIRPGVTWISVGSKVKVYYKDDGINAIFPNQAKARLWLAKQNDEEKKAVQLLFLYFLTKYERNFYPEIINMTAQDQDWNIVVNELNMEVIKQSEQTNTYIVNTDEQSVERSEIKDINVPTTQTETN